MPLVSDRLFPACGRIDREWIETPSDADPWLLVSEDPNNPDYRDAVLGNGMIGLRVPPEGEGEAYAANQANMPPSGCLIHGLWTDDRLMIPPRWHGLAYDNGHGLLRRDEGIFHNYRQELDMRSATITTTMDWERNGKRTEIQTRMWLSRAQDSALVIEQEFTPHFDGTIACVDSLGAVELGQWREMMAAHWQHYQDEQDTVCRVRMGEGMRQLAVCARIVCTHPHKQSIEVHEDPTRGLPGIRRRTVLQVRSGQTYRVIKLAALMTDAETDEPLVGARMVLESLAADLPTARNQHEAAWAQCWQHRIEVGNTRLQQLLNAALFQCYAQVPTSRPHSLGPAALSGMNWHGRAFWDADLWTFPVVAMLQPQLGRSFTAYRAATIDGARRNAAARGYQGACWAWESAETGDEKVPAPPVHHQRHINACVALAQWWDLLITGDEAWFEQHGAEIIIESANYFSSRVSWNTEQDRFELRHIKCPDEFAGIRDNNATTNYACIATLQLAQRACALTGRDPSPRWQTIIDKMWIPYDEQADRLIEYEGFNAWGEYDDGRKKIKQADTTLLVYPWQMPMSETCKRNTLAYYRSLYDDGKIMMSSAIDGIVDCELGDTAKAWESFCDLLPHVRGPFMLVSERPQNECLSFITGIGGLLQLVVNGFAGLRLAESGPTFSACLPEAVGGLTIHGLHLRGQAHMLRVVDGAVQVEVMTS